MKYALRFFLGIAFIFLLAACGTQAPYDIRADTEPNLETEGGTISYDDGTKRIYSFLVSKGRLKVNYWNGTIWQWADQGLPPNATGMTDFDLQGLPSVVTFKGSNNKQHIQVFVRGRDKHLYMNYWNGSSWTWRHLGTPGGLTNLAYHNPEAITYKDEAGRQRSYVFVKGSNNRLYVNYWVDGVVNWAWSDRGLPAGVSGIYPDIRATSYFDRQTGKQRIYAFASSGQRLYVHYWDGFTWRWADQGKALGNNVAGVVAVTSFRYVLKDWIYALVRGANDRIYVNYWNGSSWQWQDLGTPAGTTASSWAKSDMVHYLTQVGGWKRMETFFRGNNGHLYILHFDDSRSQKWYWEDQGMPPGTTVYTLHGATTYRDPNQRVYAFVKDANGGYHVNYTLDSAVTGQRNWAFQGTP